MYNYCIQHIKMTNIKIWKTPSTNQDMKNLITHRFLGGNIKW